MGGFGAIGLGLAGAIGAAIAYPKEVRVAILGDGGFMMHLSELATAVSRELPLVVLVYNDGAYGAEHTTFERHGVNTDHSLIAWPEFAPIATALGAKAITIRKLEELDELTELTTNLRGPLFVDIKLDPNVSVVPHS